MDGGASPGTGGGEGAWRTFVGVPLSDGVRAALEREQRDLAAILRARVGWTRPEGIHLTLRFLGDQDPRFVAEVAAAMARVAAGFRPFTVAARGLGCFPGASRPRVVWAGVEGGAEVRALHRAVEDALEALGIPREGRPFRPHLTLGRLRGPPGAEVARRLADALERRREASWGEIEVREVVVWRSELAPGGTRHHPEFRAPLGEPRGP